MKFWNGLGVKEILGFFLTKEWDKDNSFNAVEKCDEKYNKTGTSFHNVIRYFHFRNMG
jgi:hypothetical protein